MKKQAAEHAAAGAQYAQAVGQDLHKRYQELDKANVHQNLLDIQTNLDARYKAFQEKKNALLSNVTSMSGLLYSNSADKKKTVILINDALEKKEE